MSIGEAWTRTLAMVGNVLRSDSWENFWTGIGTGRDKTEAGTFYENTRLTDAELSALYHHDDIAGRVVDIIPREMLRQGFVITCQDPKAAKDVGDKTKALGALDQVKMAFTWGRCFGGALLLVGADDGQDPIQPLDMSRIRSLTFLHIYDRRYAWPATWYENPRNPKYGQPKTYRLTNYRTGGISVVHESRVIRFDGAPTGDLEKYRNDGWDFSVLQRPYPAIRQFSNVYKSAELLMADASQGVFKLRGLLQMIAGGNLKDLQTRAQLLDMSRSVARSVMLDADGGEDFTKVATSFAGIGDMLDRSANRTAAATGIPVTLLMGQAPAGLNATGASDIRVWYDNVQADREQDLKPRLECLVKTIAASLRYGDRQFQITFPPLWQETPKEKADREQVEATTAGVWITNEVLTPEAVAIAKFGGPEPQPYRVNPEALKLARDLPPEEVPGSGYEKPPGQNQG